MCLSLEPCRGRALQCLLVVAGVGRGVAEIVEDDGAQVVGLVRGRDGQGSLLQFRGDVPIVELLTVPVHLLAGHWR